MTKESNGLLAHTNSTEKENKRETKHPNSFWRHWIPWRCHSQSLETSGFLQIFLFTWMNHIIRKGLQKTLEQEDLGNCPDTLKSKQTLKKLKVIIYEQEKKNGKHNISLFWIYMLLIRRKLLTSVSFVGINIIVEFLLAAVFVRELMEFLESGDLSMEYGLSRVGLVGLMLTFRAGFENVNVLLSLRLGDFSKSAFLGLIYEKAVKLKNSGNQSAGELVNLCANDTQRIFFCGIFLPKLIGLPLIVVLVTSYLCVYFGPASLVGSTVLILYMPLQVLFGRLFVRLRASVVKITDKRVKMISEVLTSIKLIKMYAWEESFAKVIYGYRKEERKGILRMIFAEGFALSTGFVIILIAHLAAVMTHITLGNELIVSKAFTLIIMYNLMTFYLVICPLGMKSLAEALVACKRIKRLLDFEEHVTINEPCVDNSNIVELEDACFAWKKSKDSAATVTNIDGDEDSHKETENSEKKQLNVLFKPDNEKLSIEEDELQPVLFNISLSVKERSLVGVCGPVGSGKSSFLQALISEMTLTYGKVRCPDSIAYVPQQAWIINTTIRENIILDKDYEENFYKDVIAACSLDDDFKLMPSGDLTEIGERGINLSGGQKQRVSLARAVYAEKDLYLLDDPLSAVDPHVGKHIFENCIRKALRNRTIIFVTHQLQYIKDCDHVIYMNGGIFAETGSYSQLMENNEDFAADIRKFHQEHKDKNLEENNFLRQVSGNSLTVSKPKLYARSFSRNSSVGSEFITASMMALEDLELVNDVLETAEKYTEEEKIKIQEGRLTKVEEKETGAVSFRTYVDFCKFGGGVLPTLVMLLWINAAVVCIILSEFGLSKYLEYHNHKQIIFNNATNNVTITMTTDGKVEVYLTMYWTFAIALFVCAAFAVYTTVFLILRASSCMHNDVFSLILHSPMSFFDSTPIGIITNRMTKDVDEIDNFLSSSAENCIRNFCRVFGEIIFICVAVPYYTFAAIVQFTIMFLINVAYRKVLRAIKRIENVSRSPIYSHLATSLQGVACIRTFGKGRYFQTKFHELVDKNILADYMYWSSSRWFSFYSDMVCVFGVVAISVIAILLKDKVPAAILGLCIAYTIRITGLFQFAFRLAAKVEGQFTSVERLNHFVKTLNPEGKFTTDDIKLVKNWPSNGSIVFDNASLRYRENLPLALKNITIKINDRDKIGIVGRTGAGKSSVTVALYRLVNLESGSIKISGVNIADIGLSDLRKNLSVIPQDPVLFIGTIRYNLDPFSEHTDEELWDVLEQAHIKEMISRLPEKLESIVSENGSNFSVGERQLICMARALLRQSKILVLDEATAAIDSQTDSKIQDMIKEAFNECTVLTIAHRLNTIMHCDKILVMEKGEVAEFDSPTSLLAKESIFKSMVKLANTRTHTKCE